MNRPGLLFLHVVGAILLFSTYITAFIMRALAEPTRDRAILGYVYRVMNRLDLFVTPVASLLLLASGFLLAGRAGIPLLEARWLAWSLALFGLTGILFVVAALPQQRRSSACSTTTRMRTRMRTRRAGGTPTSTCPGGGSPWPERRSS